MKAVIVTKHGDPDKMEIQDVSMPIPGPNEICIKVSKAGINFADILSRMGLYPGAPKPPFTPGMEVSGTIHELGPDVEGFEVGDRVVGSGTNGGYAEYTVSNCKGVFKIPKDVSFEVAASFPAVYLTSYLMIIHPGDLQPGESILIHGAAGGVGLASIELAKIAGAKTIFGTCSPSKHEFIQERGVLPVDKDNFLAEIMQWTDDKGVDLVLDPIGGEHLMQSYRCLGSGGRVCSFGISDMAPGKKRSHWHRIKSWLSFPKFDPLKMMTSNRGVFGIHLGRWKNWEHLDKARKDLMGWISEGKISPHVDKVFPSEKVSDAHHYIQDRKNIGKVLLDFD
jgi:NADPH:quinone reductase-like Zn-dependent oxidoreductase|tara:strand:+ start:1136 stop:2146 length:1011 start_codon:yes stop_codon:yes gene_type:complete